MANERTVWLDALKGWGILFIVLGHVVGAGCHLSTGAAQSFCTAAYKYFYAFHVPLFFVVAGMTFHRQPWGRFFRGKFLRLLVPYFIFGVLAATIYSLTASASTELLNASDTTGYYQGKTGGISFGHQLLNLVLGGWYHIGFVGNSVLWFLPALFSVELVAQGFVRLEIMPVRRWVLWGICLLLAFSLYVWVKMPRLPWTLGLVPKYLPYFILGTFLGLREINCPRRILLPCSIMGVIGFGTLAVMNPYQWYERNLIQHLISIGIAVGNCTAWWALAQTASCRVLVHCGVWSLGIMLMHKYPVLLLQNYVAPVRRLFTSGFSTTFLAVVLISVFAVCACLMGCWVIQRGMPWMLGIRKVRK